MLEFYADAEQHLYIDGELYFHGRALQDISGYARREDKPDDLKVNFMVYDVFDPSRTLTYTERREILNEIFENFKFEYCKPVETFQVNSSEQIKQLYNRFLEEGYEGAMIRLDEPYRYSHNDYHSKVLLKMKPTIDSEFEICGYESGTKGKAASALMIICKTPGGIEFPVTPAMELPDRIALFKKMSEVEPDGKTLFESKWKGHKIIVYYDELSKDQVPQRARTKLEIRDIIE
jgi:ATP-dependent DNA ligase